MVRILALLAACLLPVAAFADPALWVVHGEPGAIYLFGTVHVLKADTAWRTPTFDAAFEASEAIEFELSSTDAPNLPALMQELALDPVHPLSSILPKADLDALATALNKTGLGTVARVEKLRPWAVAAMLSAKPAADAGYTSADGVEKRLRDAAIAAGKSVTGLETMEQQIHFLADMPDEQQIQFLESALKTSNGGSAVLSKIVAQWQDGNMDALAEELQTGMKTPYPGLYQRLIGDRNAAWAKTLEARLQQPGTLFVGVGAAHLAGPDGLPALLARDGLRVERVQ